jgi:hypothetical protein
MKELINISLKIMPFGHVSIESKGMGNIKEEEKEFPIYTEPKTTCPQFVEFIFGEKNYVVPKTTSGYL